jgi:nucleotide-binding universal stress UspA family protein
MFRHVIVGVDGDPSGHDAVAVAGLLVAQDGHLALAHVYELTPFRGASGAYGPLERDESRRLLEETRQATGTADAELIDITASSVGRGLHYLAETRDADLLVVGSSARTPVGRVLLGDITRAALSGAPCAVAVAPLGYARAGDPTIARVGVGYDGTAESAVALAFARDLAATHGASLHALTVVEPSGYAALLRGGGDGGGYEDQLAAAKSELDALEGVEGTVVFGLAGEELAAFGARVDVLVIGSRGYGPIRRLMMGSTAVHLASNSRCPLVVLPRESEDDAAS